MSARKAAKPAVRSTTGGTPDFWRDRPDAFADDEIRFLESVAGQAAMAVANARLHQRTVALSLIGTPS